MEATKVDRKTKSNWYVVKVATNKERSVGEKLQKESEVGDLMNIVQQVIVPIETTFYLKDGKKMKRDKVKFPSYVFVETTAVGELKYFMKGMNGVGGFLTNRAGEIIPLTQIEVNRMIGDQEKEKEKKELDTNVFIVGEEVTILDGPFNGFNGKVESANDKKVKVAVSIFGRVNIIDLKAMAAFSKKHGLLLAVDNTFASPYLQNPLDLGADIVMHSVTKYLGGHSDVVMGALIVNDDELASRLVFLQNACGATPGPQDCFLVLRGIKTLHLRMERHCQNGKVIAEYLRNHPKVAKVYWPGFEDHPNHQVAKSQMRDFGGMISFTLVGNQLADAKKVMENFHLFALAESLGGVESLCGHPASMTHASIPKEDREKVGLVDSLIRLSVGVEDVEDLKKDLADALAKV